MRCLVIGTVERPTRSFLYSGVAEQSAGPALEAGRWDVGYSVIAAALSQAVIDGRLRRNIGTAPLDLL